MPVTATVHVVEQLLVVFDLVVPLVRCVVAEVVTKWNKHYVVLVQLSFLSILV